MNAEKLICKCEKIELLEGRDANEYANQHLKKMSVNGATWEILYKCPETGIRWMMNCPQSEAHGGGPPRLRKITNFD